MKFFFYFGHPAQYLFLRDTLRYLYSENHEIKIFIKSKDVLENLVQSDGFQYENILPKQRGISKVSVLISLIRRILYLFPIVYRGKPDVLISTDAPFAIIGKILGIDRITITEDDYKVVRTFANIAYPFAQTILCPTVCDVGKWEEKKVGYSGYMKLAYLHPAVFQPDKNILIKYNLPEKYAIIRLAKLSAHHDFGVKGISDQVLMQIINIFRDNGISIFISAEGDLTPNYSLYKLNIIPKDMHHVLSFAACLVCDSQSMTVEAALLGVPSIRVSSLVGRISVLNELEQRYNLTIGVHPEFDKDILDILNKLLSQKDLKLLFSNRKDKMLREKINVNEFLKWFIAKYPQSCEEMKLNPEKAHRFLD